MKLNIDVTDSSSIDEIEKSWNGKTTFLLAPQPASRLENLSTLSNFIPEQFAHNHFGLYTSGSTGKPKLVIGSKKRTENLTRVIHEAQNCEPVNETICILPLSYSFALVNQWLWARIYQRKFTMNVGLSQFDRFKGALKKADSAMLCLVASQVPVICKQLSGTTFTNIIRINFAGEMFPQEKLLEVQKIFPKADIYNNYGCTEALPRITTRKSSESNDPTNIGKPLSGIELRADNCGKLIFRSPFSAVALVDSSETHLLSHEDWIETGDYGEPCPDGSWRVLGRTNEIFKRYGEKISMASILNEIQNETETRVYGYPVVDSKNMPSWSLVFISHDGFSSNTVKELLNFFRRNHTRPHWPLRIESMASLPKLPNGKIDIQALKDAENRKLHWRQRI